MQKVVQYIERHKLFSLDDKILVAVSGGADSVSMLHVLLSLQDTLGIRVEAAHFNHHLRGAESDRDEHFVRQLCLEHRVTLHTVHFNTEQEAKERHISIEMAARELRYAWFEKTREACSAAVIAVAHHQDDSVETLLLNLIRGTGINGLRGIRPRNGHIVRPLLCLDRKEIVGYLESIGQAYVTDSTNLTDQYTRNRIRHQIMPRMKELNPSVERTVSYTIHGLRRDADFLSQQAQEAYARCHAEKNTLAGLVQLHPALQVRCIAMLLEEAGLSYDAPLLERLQKLLYKGGRWNLSGAVFAAAKQGILTLEAQKPQTKPDPVLLQWGENCLYPGCVVTAELITAENSDSISIVHGKFANSILDYDKIKNGLVLRQRRPGDFMMIGGGHKKAIRRILMDDKVPQLNRETLNMLTDGGHVLWIPDTGRMSEYYKITGETRLILSAELKEIEE